MLEKMSRKSRHGGRVQRRTRHQIVKATMKHLRNTNKRKAFAYEAKANN